METEFKQVDAMVMPRGALAP